ncbi:MAG TPA: CPBP family glutamic-type intramembrane protease [Waterburya sp.]|jgi:predicted Abi (CAAX) family protease
MQLLNTFDNCLRIIFRRIIQAYSILPTVKTWIFSLWLLLCFAIIILPLGLASKFLTFEPVHLSWLNVITLIGIALIAPAIREEVFYRVILLPHQSERATFKTKCIWGSISLIVYIVAHPLSALTVFPSGFPTFTNPVFLLAAALLGLICMTVYWRSGSLWPPVIIHWLVVVLWLLLLGGYGKLHQP